MSRTINDFLSRLRGGGARPNRFRIICPFPSYAIVGGETETMSFLAKSASLPGSILGVIEIPFNGKKIKLPGDREYTTGWEATIINDTDFKLRNAFERWNNGIVGHESTEALSNLNDFSVDVTVEQLDQADRVIKSYTLVGAWCKEVQQVELSYDSENVLSETVISFEYQFLRSNTLT